jgi:hypothetical protein
MYDSTFGWEALANAIIITAIEDLRLACKGEGEAAEELKDECIDFLLSRRAAQLTTADRGHPKGRGDHRAGRPRRFSDGDRVRARGRRHEPGSGGGSL